MDDRICLRRALASSLLRWGLKPCGAVWGGAAAAAGWWCAGQGWARCFSLHSLPRVRGTSTEVSCSLCPSQLKREQTHLLAVPILAQLLLGALLLLQPLLEAAQEELCAQGREQFVGQSTGRRQLPEALYRSAAVDCVGLSRSRGLKTGVSSSKNAQEQNRGQEETEG